MTCKSSTIKQPWVLITHIVVALFLAYLSWSIISRKCPPLAVGYGLALLVIILLAAQVYFYINESKGTKEALCLCTGARNQVCQNRELVTKLYREGILTEISNLVR